MTKLNLRENEKEKQLQLIPTDANHFQINGKNKSKTENGIRTRKSF